MPFFVRQKVQILSKIFATNPKFCHFFAIWKWGPLSSA